MVQNIPFRTITSPNRTEDVISRYSYKCKKFEINILKIKICLNITKKNLMKNKFYRLFAGFIKNLYAKRTQTLWLDRR